jgi:hypothetical protein
MLGTVITAYFDGTQILTATDAALATGSAGLRSDTGTSYCYELNIAPQAQNTIGVALEEDTFVRADQSGFGTSSNGRAWTFTGHGSTNAIASHEGVIKANANNDTHGQLDASTTATDQVITCRIAVGDNGNDVAGIQARFTAASGTTCYKLLYYSNGLHINKAIAGSNSNLANSGTFTPTNNTYYWFKFYCQDTTLRGKVWQDGTSEPAAWQVTATDSSVASGGFAILASTSSTNGVSFDHFQAATMPTTSVFTRMTLSSSNPVATPQVLDLATFVGAASFGPGTLLPTAPYNGSNSYVENNIDDAKTQSDYWTNVSMVVDSNGNYPVSFAPRTAVPAPWPLDENNKSVLLAGQAIGDVLLAGLSLSKSADLYRNRQILRGVIATATFVQPFSGDGQTQSWQVANDLAAPPTKLALNGQTATFGVQGDSGKQFYYLIGSKTIIQDSSGTVLTGADTLTVTYIGSYVTEVVRDNTAFAGTVTQSMLAAITNDSGIVENIVDVSGQNMTVAAANTYGDQLLKRFGVHGITFGFSTLRSGLAPGQQLAVYVPSYNANNLQALVTEVQISEEASTAAPGGFLYIYRVMVQTGAALGSWIKQLSSGLSS